MIASTIRRLAYLALIFIPRSACIDESSQEANEIQDVQRSKEGPFNKANLVSSEAENHPLYKPDDDLLSAWKADIDEIRKQS